MRFSIQNPLGLLVLVALPLIWWLHRFVLRGPDARVSCILLWQERDSSALEGSTRRRPPLTLVLILELFAALCLSLVVADVRIALRAADEPRVGIVLDRGASMGGGPRAESAWDEVRRLLPGLAGGDVRVTLIGSGPEPSRLGGSALTLREAVKLMAEERPGFASHPLEPAIELLSELGVERDEMVIFSDRNITLDRLVHVGKPAPNTAIVNASWELGMPPMIVLRHFGDIPRPTAVEVTVAGAAPRAIAIPWDSGGTARLSAETPASADMITFGLSDDALAADNRVTLLRPLERRLRGRVDHENSTIRRAFERALIAAGAEVVTARGAMAEEADLVVTGRPSGEAGPGELRVVVPAKTALLSAPIFVADRSSPLVDGVEVQGLVWFGQAGHRAEHPLLVAGRTALVWAEGAGLALQLDPGRSNLLQHPAFALLVANWVHAAAERQGGLLRRNFRVGERLRFERGRECRDQVRLRTPSGREQELGETSSVLESGPLAEVGLYRLSCGERDETLAVNLLDATESDLTDRHPAAGPRTMVSASTLPGSRASLILALLLLASLSAVAAAWFLVGRRRGVP